MVLLLNNYFVEKKKVRVALRKIFGIGLPYSKNLCARLGISDAALIKDLTSDHIKLLSKFVNAEFFIDKELKNELHSDIKKKIKIKCYKGLRHTQGLPVNGQNTKNNSKTAKYLLRQIKHGS